MKKHFKRILALTLALVTCMGVFSAAGLTASAASADVYMVQLPRGDDPNRTGWGHPAMTFVNGWRSSSSEHVTVKSIGTYESSTVYCIEPGVPLHVGDTLNSKGEDFWDDYPENLNDKLSADQIKTFLGRIFVYGWTGKNNLDWDSSNPVHAQEIAETLATQFLVWETVVGDRDDNFNWIAAPSGKNNILDMLTSAHPLRSEIMAHYTRIENAVKNHVSRPSFLSGNLTGAQTHELAWDGSKYSVTLTDTNNLLGSFTFSSTTPGVSFSVSGNKLTISMATAPTGDVNITASKNGNVRRTTVVWTDFIMSNSTSGQIQDLVSYGAEVADPVTGYVKIKISTGALNILKTTKNNDEQVSGFQFRVTKDGTNIGTYTSGSDGRINIPNLVAGWYKVEEVNLSDDFVKPTPNPVDVEIKGGQTAMVNFDNVKKLGVITVQKTNANPVMGDYSLAGAEFIVKNANDAVVDTITTDATGKGQSKPLPLGTYTVFESKAPWGFVVDKNIYTRTLSGIQGTAAIVYCPQITVPERPQTGQVKITKLDAETTATAQGDATLSGAVFSLIDSKGNEVERLYCGSNSLITSKEVPLGSYIVKEIVPPKGYTLSQKEYPVTIDYAGQEVEINLVPTEVKNIVIKGRIAIIKHSDSPDPQVDPENEQVQEPLDGIVFRVYLKSAGSYENAKPSERDELVTNENGWALSKDLPYGTYVIEEVKGEPEHKVCAPFDAFISENDRTYYYNVENPAYYGRVKIVKVDETTDKLIPQANVEFRVKNADTGEWVTQEILYPTPVFIDSYLTNAEGWLVMPQELKFGNYELHEINAPYGYMLSEKPIPFKVTSENPVAYLEVKMLCFAT